MKTIVTGNPRTGTSLSMMILDKGGIKAEHNLEINKAINPYGSFETHNFKTVPEGKSFKCLNALELFDLPAGEYKVIMPVRDTEQIVLSRIETFNQKQMPPNMELQKQQIEKQYRFLRFIVENRPDMELLEIPYDDYFLKIDETIDAIAEFVDVEFDKKKAKKAIDPEYYKIRTVEEVSANLLKK